MSDRVELIKKHLGDQLALERHILEAVERQRSEEALRESLEANKIVIEVERVLKLHITELEQLGDAFGVNVQSLVKKAVTELLGVVAGLYDKVREQIVSRMIRDDYTALSLAAMGYTAFHTFGKVTQEDRIAELSLRHLQNITPLLVRISRVLPVVVVDETAKDLDIPFDEVVAEEAVVNTHRMWSSEVVNSTQT